MSDREQILKRVKAQPQVSHPLPSLDQAWIQYDDPREQFQTSLASVGGQSVVVQDNAELVKHLSADKEFNEASRVFSQVNDIARANVNLEEMQRPHDAEDVDFAIFQGQFGVAENGAVWLETSSMKHRSILFIAQYVALVIPAAEVVHNMHEAYERISFLQPGFGVFVSGPSKTADIEQSLVIGAHGPRSLRVFLLMDGLHE